MRMEKCEWKSRRSWVPRPGMIQSEGMGQHRLIEYFVAWPREALPYPAGEERSRPTERAAGDKRIFIIRWRQIEFWGMAAPQQAKPICTKGAKSNLAVLGLADWLRMGSSQLGTSLIRLGLAWHSCPPTFSHYRGHLSADTLGLCSDPCSTLSIPKPIRQSMLGLNCMPTLSDCQQPIPAPFPGAYPRTDLIRSLPFFLF
jgi:hypothetical protein